MAKLTEPIRYLDMGEMEKIHRTALRILEEVGMRIYHRESLEYLRNFGCKVDMDKFHVSFPQDLTQKCVDKMRKDYNNPERLPEWMAVRYSRIGFRKEQFRIHPDFSVNTGGFCCFIRDFEGKRRRATLEDVRMSLKLADSLEHITFAGLPCSAQEISDDLRPIKMAAELVKITKKTGGVEAFNTFDVEYISRIAKVVDRGRENPQRNPVLVGYGEARTPLCIDKNMAEIFIAYIKKGMPQTLDTMPNGGATAPVTAAGLIALGVAETLGGLILGYSVDKNAVVGVDIIPSYCDMQSGLFQYSPPHRMPLLSARVQMISEYYGCPSGVHGEKTDSCIPGVQVGIEKAWSMLIPVLSGTIGIGTVGHLENAVTFSPEQLVIDNEIAGSIHHMLKGIEVNDETLAFDVIKEVGIGNTYLNHEHTFKHFRDEMFLSELFERLPWDSAYNQEIKGMQGKAYQKAKQLVKEERPRPLTKDQEKEIDEIVKEAESKLSNK